MLDAEARAAGRIAISGAGTLPALSTAVIDQLAHDMTHVDRLELVVAPGLRARGGQATPAAALACLGRSLRVWREGQWQRRLAWRELGRVSLADGRGYALPCDLADLELLPPRYRVRQQVGVRVAIGGGARPALRIDMRGERRGERLVKRWELQAPAASGPEIACLPAILLSRRLASDPPTGPGAYRCMGFLRLGQFGAEFRRLGIETRLTETPLTD